MKIVPQSGLFIGALSATLKGIGLSASVMLTSLILTGCFSDSDNALPRPIDDNTNTGQMNCDTVNMDCAP